MECYFLRNDVEATVLRLPGQLYEHKEDNIISNVYTYKVVNKTSKDIMMLVINCYPIKVKLKLVTHKDFIVPKQGLAEGTLFIEIHSS